MDRTERHDGPASAPKGKNPGGKTRGRLNVSRSRLPFQAFLLFIFPLSRTLRGIFLLSGQPATHLVWFSSAGEALLFLPLAACVLIESWPHLGWPAALFFRNWDSSSVLYREPAASLPNRCSLGLCIRRREVRGHYCPSGGILVLGEHPSVMAGVGALLVTAGILLVCGGLRTFRAAGDGPDFNGA